jgi:hypothetical protein
MNLSDQEVAVMALREAQLILGLHSARPARLRKNHQ